MLGSLSYPIVRYPSIIALAILSFTGCTSGPDSADDIAGEALFTWLTAPEVSVTGVNFRNDLTYTEELNPYTYRNFYNGGGVGIGDFDRNGFVDLYFTGNLVHNALYLNQGNFQFREVTAQAGVACPDSWSTGVAVVDINADGWLDLYICKAGPPEGETIDGMTGVRHNELFVNQQDGTFVESAGDYGLDVVGLSVHSAFFDYDGDGDLDCYLLNNSTRATTGFDLESSLRTIPDEQGGNMLLQNQLSETGRTYFTDVTQEAGIYSSNIGFGLGVTVGDVNRDGWPDLYISNDYFERDYLYLNNGNGTFREELTEHLAEISKGSMGADLADLNNDGLPELFVTEMLPATERRYKTKAAFDGWNRYQLYRDRGYHQQFSRNVLQMNRGGGYFSEVGRFAGVEATDWSWGALLCDLDNDGLRDIFVANGTGKDLLDQDYINFNGNPAAVRRMINEEGKGITDLIDLIPSEALVNGVFRNTGDLSFVTVADEWGLNQATFSNGAAYADLDNDGDLDLLTNNVNGKAGVYRNNSTVSGRLIELVGAQPGNPAAIGAVITNTDQEDSRTYTELFPMRGFQSTVDYRILLPPGVDTVVIHWPQGGKEMFSTGGDRMVTQVKQGHGTAYSPGGGRKGAKTPRPVAITRPLVDGQELTHAESPAIDFDRDPLLFIGINNEGPALATSDWNNDGISDLYFGGSAGEPGRMLQGQGGGRYHAIGQNMLMRDAAGENLDALFFDADGDGDKDLYVVNGSNQFGKASTALLDVLYINKGGGNWERDPQVLPVSHRLVAGSVVAANDVDGDGDLDLFVGGRFLPGTYGVPAESYILLNDGKGNFTSADSRDLKNLGLVTDAVWANVDADDQNELIVVGEWAPIRYLHFSSRGKVEAIDTIPDTYGLWNCVAAADMNGDGITDIAAGNHGLNSRLRASPDRPLRLYVNDFDGNGKAEQILTRFAADGKEYPFVLRDDLVKQLPHLRKRIGTYADYQGKTMEDLFEPRLLQRSVVLSATELRSLVILNGNGEPEVNALPDQAQLAPIYVLLPISLNEDSLPDLFAAGNQSVGRPEMGIYSAGFGSLLLNEGEGVFTDVPPLESGLYLSGDIRAAVPLDENTERVLVARSGGPAIQIEFSPK